MKAFNRELMRRSPLAAAVLETCDFLFDDAWLAEVYEAHRGRRYEDKLTFGQFLRLTRDALLRHGGSARQLFVELEADKGHPIGESNFYRKLSRTPPAPSRGYKALYRRTVTQAPAGCDFDFLMGEGSGT